MAQPPSTEWQCFRIKVQSDLTAAAARLLKGLGTEVVLCCQQFHQPLKSRCFCCCQSHFFPPEFPFFILAFFHLLAFEIFHGMAFLVWFPPLKHHCLMASWPGRLPKSNSFPDSWNVERRTSRRQWGPSNWSHWTSPCILSWKKRVPGPGCRNKFLKKRSKNPGVTRSWMFGLGPISEPIYLQIMGGFHVKSWRCNQRKWGYSHDLTEVIGFLFPLPFDWSSGKVGIIPWLYNKYSIESQWWFLIE